jgi:hypothetical protein
MLLPPRSYGKPEAAAAVDRLLMMGIIIIIIIIIESIVSSRNIGCLRVLSTSVYRLLRTSVHSSFYPLP